MENPIKMDDLETPIYYTFISLYFNTQLLDARFDLEMPDMEMGRETIPNQGQSLQLLLCLVVASTSCMLRSGSMARDRRCSMRFS